MGSIRIPSRIPTVTPHGLHDHEGYVGQVLEDGTIHGGGLVSEAPSGAAKATRTR